MLNTESLPLLRESNGQGINTRPWVSHHATGILLAQNANRPWGFNPIPCAVSRYYRPPCILSPALFDILSLIRVPGVCTLLDKFSTHWICFLVSALDNVLRPCFSRGCPEPEPGGAVWHNVKH